MTTPLLGMHGIVKQFPGVRALDAAVSAAVDRINRPLDLLTSAVRTTGSPGDPAFPSTIATLVVTVTRP